MEMEIRRDTGGLFPDKSVGMREEQSPRSIHICKRDLCVLCENSKLLDIKSIKIPLYTINNPDDKSWDMNYGYCENCYSIQLKTLLDPEILYDKNYVQPVSTCYNWIQHNISFINFIIKSVHINNPLIEIGSSSFVLGKHLIDYYKDYTVFDYSLENATRREGIKYIEGNCENYNFPSNSTIIMSHVFEHLYTPKKFIENCKKNCVENIIISIPNMNNNSECNVFNQHTFLYDDNDIEYIFNLNNYKLTNKKFFNVNDNSFPCLFFYFTLLKEDKVSKEPILYRRIIENRHLITYNFFKKISTYNVPKNTFIATAGMMTITIYNSLLNKDNIIGIIDYNKTIQNKKFGNTNLIIQPYEYLIGYSSEYSIIVFGYRKLDIIKHIRDVNTNINIITTFD